MSEQSQGQIPVITEERQGQIAVKMVKLSFKMNGIPSLDRGYLNAFACAIAREIDANPIEVEVFLRTVFTDVVRDCYPESSPTS